MARNQWGEVVHFERTDVGGKVVTTKGPVWSGSTTFVGGRPRIIDELNRVYVMGDGLLRQPPEISAGGGVEWTQVERSGLKPLTRYGSQKLRTLEWKVNIGAKDWRRPVEGQVKWLLERAENGRAIRFSGHGSPLLEHGRWWIIADTSVTVTRRTPAGLISRAEVTLSLIERVEVPFTTAAKRKPKARLGAAKPRKVKKERVYVMKRGDTLWALARRYYSNPFRWKILAKRNKIKNVRRIPIGKRIYIP